MKKNMNSTDNIAITVDGPYGLPFDYKQFSSILLIGGGIGVTPLHSILRTLLLLNESSSGLSSRLRVVKLVWSVREIHMVEMFRDTFERVLDQQIKGGGGVRFELAIHCTTSSPVDGAEKGTNQEKRAVPISNSRLQLRKEIEALLGVDDGIVFVCGPEGMVQEASALTSSLNIPFHAETFLL